MVREAVISPDGRYRYALSRAWAGHAPSYALFVMLNPSTADALKDDSTIRRCVGYARSWGYGGLLVANLYAHRATDPRELRQGYADIVGPENDKWLRAYRERAAITVAAWGAGLPPTGPLRVRQVVALLGEPLYCLGLTQGGHPRHPLRLPATLQPERFEVGA